MSTAQKEVIAGEEVSFKTDPPEVEKKHRKKRSDAGMKRGERKGKAAEKTAKKSKKTRRTTRRRFVGRVVEETESGYPEQYTIESTRFSDAGPRPYRVLGGAIAGVFRHHKEQLKRVDWKKWVIPAATIGIPVAIAFFAGWAFGAR